MKAHLHLVPKAEPEIAANNLAVTRVSLSYFRNYADVRLTLDQAPVVLIGKNGGGKTNMLEAISLLVPGRGLRRASSSEIQHRGTNVPWAVAAEIVTPEETLTVGTGCDPQEKDRRVVHIAGKIAKNQQALAELMAMAWITPDMDRVLAEGASARRRFLDRLVYSFDPAHAGRVYRYEKALRERLHLLRETCRPDVAWLAALEDDMAQTGVAIAAARRQLVRQLQAAIAETASAFPQADLVLQGVAEEALDNQPALLIEDHLRAAWAKSRDDDAQNGACSIGPHRSDLIVIHRVRECPAETCSTGEQKALLIALVLAHARLLRTARQKSPLLLLDDITAHLDETRRAALFDEIRALGSQAWLTGTDRESFRHLLPHAQALTVEQGCIFSP